jgi:RNA polymerase sigma factor (TIGR02999 family)
MCKTVVAGHCRGRSGVGHNELPHPSIQLVSPMSDVTRILSAIEQGDPEAAAQLWPLVYAELRQLAAQKLAREKPGQTLQATGLVHEAYLRLVANAGGEPSGDEARWQCRGHFFAAAAEAMRRILIDQARRKHSAKRGGDRQRLPLDDVASLASPDETPQLDLLALDEALRQLEAEEPVKARLVKLRFFAGTSLVDAARMLGISPATAKRYWVYSRSWLYGKLHDV